MLLMLVFGLGLSLRLYRLGSIPSGLFCDEAANGYEAFSLATTGLSTDGRRFPLLLNHHGIDYVESLYVQASRLSVLSFGLTPFSTRLVAAIAGSLTILTTFLLTRALTERWCGLVAAFLVAVSPWHFQFSRAAFRGILLPLFLTLGLYLFLRSLESHRHWALSGLVWGLTLHSYSVAKALTPMVLLLLAALYGRRILSAWRSGTAARRQMVLGAAIFLMLALPMFYLTIWGSGGTRMSEISIFAHPRPLRRFLVKYLLQVNPIFLFLQGDFDPRATLGPFGQLLLILLPLAVIGWLAGRRHQSAAWPLLPALFLLGSLPPALTVGGGPHALRGIGAVPFVEIMAAMGLVALVSAAGERSQRLARAAAAALVLVVAFNAVLFLRFYFSEYPAISAYGYQFGWEEAIAIAEREQAGFDWIALAPRFNQPYVFPLFFARVDPEIFREQGVPEPYQTWSTLVRRVPAGRHLFVTLHCEAPQGTEATLWSTIRGPDGAVFLRLWEVELPAGQLVGIAKTSACWREPEALRALRIRRMTRALYIRLRAALGVPEIHEQLPIEAEASRGH